MSQFKTKEFKALQEEWDKKLSSSGFVDIEHRPSGNLRSSDEYMSITRWDQSRIDAKVEYYRLAGQFLHSHKFESKAEKRIWELHAEGQSVREIEEKMKNYKTPHSKSQVHLIVAKLAKEMLDKCRTP